MRCRDRVTATAAALVAAAATMLARADDAAEQQRGRLARRAPIAGAPGRRNATVATDRGSAPGDASARSRSCCTSAADA